MVCDERGLFTIFYFPIFSPLNHDFYKKKKKQKESEISSINFLFITQFDVNFSFHSSHRITSHF